jgi:small conductance mechanosensitive channel
MNLKPILFSWLPFGAAVLFGFLILFGIKKFMDFKASKSIERSQVGPQLTLLIMTIGFIVVLILSTPLSENTKGQLLSLIGILLTAAIALSSTTFLGNIMAGFMIRTLRKFDPGDFVRIDDFMGRVTELGLLHTEVQLEDRDLAIIPNLHLVTRPMKVIHSSGTLVTEEVSLGYDINPQDIEAALLKAAENTGLEDAFVHIQSLGDFSVVYRLAGFFKDTRKLVSTKAKLRRQMLDTLHANGLEIVSPNFMNQRVYSTDSVFIPKTKYRSMPTRTKEVDVDDLIFDKAEEAETIENIKDQIEKVDKMLEELKDKKEDKSVQRREYLQGFREKLHKRLKEEQENKD